MTVIHLPNKLERTLKVMRNQTTEIGNVYDECKNILSDVKGWAKELDTMADTVKNHVAFNREIVEMASRAMDSNNVEFMIQERDRLAQLLEDKKKELA